MTKHTGPTQPGNGSTASARHPAPGRSREVSERIYDYISTGHPDRRDDRAARSTHRP